MNTTYLAAVMCPCFMRAGVLDARVTTVASQLAHGAIEPSGKHAPKVGRSVLTYLLG
jgi:hypothetical protein